MKKILAFLCVGTMMLGCNAYAFDYAEDYGMNAVTVSGKVQPGEMASIQVLKEGLTFEDAPADANFGTIVVHNDQMRADDEGNVKFYFRINEESGVYNAYIRSLSMPEAEHIAISFINSEQFKEITRELNKAAEEDDYDLFAKIIADNDAIFAPVDGVGDVNLNSAMKLFFEDVTETALDVEDSAGVMNKYNTYLIIGAVNQSKMDDFYSVLNKIVIPEEISGHIADIEENSKRKDCFNEYMSSGNIDTVEELEDKIIEAVILSVVACPDGYSEVKDIMTEFKDEIGISGKASDSVYKKLAGNEFESLDALREKYNDLSGNKSSSSSSSGGGGRGSAATSTTRVGSDEENENKVDAVKVSFIDIDNVMWANEAIIALADKGIINGKSEGYFCPDDLITREEFVKILIGALKIDADANAENVFTDVDASMWYAPFVNTAYANKIVSGLGNGRFGTGENITRQDIAVMLYNAVEGDKAASGEGELVDMEAVSDYAAPAVSFMAANKVVNGNENKEFMPLSPATRAEAAQMVYNAMKLLQIGG